MSVECLTKEEAEALVKAYEDAFVCTECGRPQGCCPGCGTFVPGWMVMIERPEVMRHAIRTFAAVDFFTPEGVLKERVGHPAKREAASHA